MNWLRLTGAAFLAIVVVAMAGSCAEIGSYAPIGSGGAVAAPSDERPATAGPSRPRNGNDPSLPRPSPSPATPPFESPPSDRGPPRDGRPPYAGSAPLPGSSATPHDSTDAIARPVPSRYDRVDEVLNQLETGNVAFNAPQRLNLEETAVIHLALSLSKEIAELEKLIVEDGDKLSYAVQVSDRMEARLTGPNFAITAITPEVQAVGRSGATEWKWEVTPKLEGKHSLHLTLTAIIDVDGRQTQHSIRTLDRNIEIYVTLKQSLESFFKKYWQWLWAAVLLPLIGWGWKKWKDRTAASR